MASRKVKLRIDTELQKKALDDAVKGIRKVDKAMDESAKTSTKMGAAGEKANKRNSYAAGQAAMQLQDVAVQAQMGTDSMRILGQQGPQLLSAFGPKGMLAGLAVAVGAGLVSAFRQPKKEASELIEEMKLLHKTGEDIADMNVEDLEKSLAATIERTNQAREAFVAMMAARDESEQRALSATDALIDAELTLKRLRGEDVTLEEEQLRVQQEQRKIQEEKEKASNELAKKQDEEKQRVIEITEQLRIQTAEIEAQRMKLASQEQVHETTLEGQSEAMEKLGTRFGVGGFTPTKAQDAALEQAGQAVDESANVLQGMRQELDALVRKQDNLRQSLGAAQRQVEQTSNTITDDLQKIDMTAKAKEVTAAGASMGKQLDILETALREGAAAVGEGAPSSVMNRLQEILKDGIQTDELSELVKVTSQLGIKLNQGFGAQNQTMKEILGQLEIQANQARIMETQIQNLKAKQKTPVR
jgi:DNA repair exonuclease SbcCD ATPase subunit